MVVYILACVATIMGYGFWVYNTIVEYKIHYQLLITGFNLAVSFIIIYFMWKGFEIFFDLD